VDVTQIPGLQENALPLFSEVGRDMSRWPSAGHFISWLALCPDNDISGGKLLWRGARKVKNRAGQLFRMAAYSLHHSLTPLGNHLRRMKAKLGPKAATMATAHKIAVIFYTMVKKQVEYDETIWDARDAQREKRLEAKLKRQANNWATNSFPSNPWLHNKPLPHTGVPWKVARRSPVPRQNSNGYL
jgi:transposase